MIETIESLGYGKKLGKYNFRPNLCSDKEQCEKWLQFCKNTDMIWFNNSYATIVHNRFDEFFEEVEHGEASRKVLKELDLYDSQNYQIKFRELQNHTVILKSKINDVHLVTSSPNYIDFSTINEYPFNIYSISPQLLEDYMLGSFNIAIAKCSFSEMSEINDEIYDKLGIYGAFRRFK